MEFLWCNKFSVFFWTGKWYLIAIWTSLSTYHQFVLFRFFSLAVFIHTRHNWSQMISTDSPLLPLLLFYCHPVVHYQKNGSQLKRALTNLLKINEITTLCLSLSSQNFRSKGRTLALFNCPSFLDSHLSSWFVSFLLFSTAVNCVV